MPTLGAYQGTFFVPSRALQLGLEFKVAPAKTTGVKCLRMFKDSFNHGTCRYIRIKITGVHCV